MAEHITSGHGDSSTISLRNKLRSIWQHIKAIPLSNFVRSLRHKFRSTPTEAELLLLICSIFADDFRIPFEDLVVYMRGSGLLEDTHDLFAARSRLHDIISICNNKKYSHKAIVAKSGLSHEDDRRDNQYGKMMDGARDLAKSVALTYSSEFFREIIVKKWPESNIYKECYGLSLVLKKVNEHPIHLECPNIALLQLQYKLDSRSLPINFFDGLTELRVLALDVPSLPQALNMLRNLRTLRLKVTEFEDTSSIGGMVNLEFLSISVLNLTEIPREIGQLKNLKLLDFRRMSITYFPPGILSRLLKLEELYLPLNFKNWGCKAKNYNNLDEFELEEEDGFGDEERIDEDISETDDQERINASLVEIVSPLLNTLQVCVPKASILPKSSPLFKNLREFRILKPNSVLYQPFGKYSVNMLQLSGDVCDIKESGVCDLLHRAEDLSLTQVQNLKNVICQLDERSFPNLKKMIVSECDELEYIVDGTKKLIVLEVDHLLGKLECLHLSLLPNLKEICHERWKSLRWFSNLSQIRIRFCPKLKYLCPLSIVEGLSLTRIEILECNEMEGIFYEEKEDNIPLTLYSIENLELYSLPRLTSFLVCKDNMIDGDSLTTNKKFWRTNGASEFPNSQEASIGKFSKEIICSRTASTSRENVQECVTQPHHFSNQVSTIKNKDAVRQLEMYSLLPSKFVAKWLGNLKSLKIAYCDLVQVIFFFEENHAASKAFNSLEVLELHGLRNLVHIWFRIPPKIAAFKNLQLLFLSDSDSSYLFSYRVAKLLVQIQKICISRCEKMEELITVKDDENEIKGSILLPRLKHMELQQLPNLRILFGGPYEVELPSLESLKLKQCNKMKIFSNGLTRMPMLEGVEVNGSFPLLRKGLNVIIKGVTIPHSFTLADLKIATKDFSSDTFSGEGAFGRLYKGWINKKSFAPSETSAGFPVAIKRFKSNNKDVVQDWKSEMDILSRKSHPNIANLLGYCSDSGEYLLVYEFIPRGRLSNHLFTGNLRGKPLSWDTRIKIAIGVARGLNFLHASDIVHRDVKVSNILVDEDYDSKTADFGLAIWGSSDEVSDLTNKKCDSKILDLGLAKSMPGDGSLVSTDVMGTWGYLDPVYARSGRVSLKSDVYSFGVVLLELMTGLKVFDMKHLEGHRNLNLWLKPILSGKGDLKNIMDSTMEGQYSSEAMSLMAHLVMECTQEDRKTRPTMGEVLDKLLEIGAIKL